jgi:hypothetical protein
MWAGGDVWILGGGPSVPKQFSIPESLVHAVVAGTSPPSVYSPYMSFLHDKHVIGINVAYYIGDWIDMVFFGDGSFFTKHKDNLARFPGLKVSCDPNCNKIPWIKYLVRDTSHPKGISIKAGAVSWNCNSGSAAISVAVQAGAKRIILLGFDMSLDNNIQHWHNMYGKPTDPKTVSKSLLTFASHLSGFPVIAQDAKRLGVEIINASPNSTIPQFPKFSVKELINNT